MSFLSERWQKSNVCDSTLCFVRWLFFVCRTTFSNGYTNHITNIPNKKLPITYDTLFPRYAIAGDITNITTNIPTNNKALIHNGDTTHHQDQSIYPVSFNPMNKIVSNPVNPIPLELLLLLLITYLSLS